MGTPKAHLPAVSWARASTTSPVRRSCIRSADAIALAGAIVLGPRLGRKFKRDGGGPMMPHDLTIAAVGGLILWFGWYGFNPGSTLSIMDYGRCRPCRGEHDAGRLFGRFDGLFCGLSPSEEVGRELHGQRLPGRTRGDHLPVLLGQPAGSLALGRCRRRARDRATDVLEYLRIDDPVGAVPVHCINGIWGTLSLGLFASGEFAASGPISPASRENGLRVCSTAAARRCSKLKRSEVPSSPLRHSSWRWSMFAILNAMGMLRVSKERRTVRSRLARARYFGLPGIPDSRLGGPGRHAEALEFV